MSALAVFEDVIDVSGTAPRIEAMLPAGVRTVKLTVRTLLAGMCLAQADHRPGRLTRVHRALISLPEATGCSYGVLANWETGARLTYRQTEYTFGLVAGALGKNQPDGLPSGPLQDICDDLLEASAPEEFKDTSRSLAVDWTDLESFSRPPQAEGKSPTPRSFLWTRKNNLLRSEDEPLFYGYYLSAGVMMPKDVHSTGVDPRTRPPRKTSAGTPRKIRNSHNILLANLDQPPDQDVQDHQPREPPDTANHKPECEYMG